MNAATRRRPQLIRQVLLQEWDLRLHREHEIGQARCRSEIRSDARQHPRASLLVHEPARAIDRIHDDAITRGRLLQTLGQDHETMFQALRNQDDSTDRRRLAAQLGQKSHVGHTIDCVNGIAAGVPCHGGE
jgi:hypothetical protein